MLYATGIGNLGGCAHDELIDLLARFQGGETSDFGIRRSASGPFGAVTGDDIPSAEVSEIDDGAIDGGRRQFIFADPVFPHAGFGVSPGGGGQTETVVRIPCPGIGGGIEEGIGAAQVGFDFQGMFDLPVKGDGGVGPEDEAVTAAVADDIGVFEGITLADVAGHGAGGDLLIGGPLVRTASKVTAVGPHIKRRRHRHGVFSVLNRHTLSRVRQHIDTRPSELGAHLEKDGFFEAFVAGNKGEETGVATRFGDDGVLIGVLRQGQSA